jgi:hypothetical protein
MMRGSAVGFHAAYTVKDGKATESAIGNALLGGYLAQLGLTEQAIEYFTKTLPSSMTWLTLPDAERVGIDVSFYDPASAASTALPSTEPPGHSHQHMLRHRVTIKGRN